MAYKLIKHIEDKIYNVGDIIPNELGKRLLNMYRIGHCEHPHVEEVFPLFKKEELVQPEKKKDQLHKEFKHRKKPKKKKR